MPWNKLGQAPVVAEFDRLYIVAAPREEQEAADAEAAPESDNDEQVLAVEQDAKRKRVLDAENEWIKVRREGEQMGQRAAACAARATGAARAPLVRKTRRAGSGSSMQARSTMG